MLLNLFQTGCLEFPLWVKTNNRIAIALGSLSIFRQVTKKEKKAVQILQHEAGKIQRYQCVAFNHFSYKSILKECGDVKKIISSVIINHFISYHLIN
jgi:hypothetical protein